MVLFAASPFSLWLLLFRSKFRFAIKNRARQNHLQICPAQFFVEQDVLTERAEAQVQSSTSQLLGSFATRPTVTDTEYSYHDASGDVVAQIEKSAFSWTYTFSRCDKAGSVFTVSRTTIFAFTNIQYNLAKDGQAIGFPSKDIFFVCKPDVIIADADNNVLATLDRSCLGSLWSDHWNVTNYKPDLIDNYVLGGIAYFVTQEENAAKSAKKKSK